MNDRENEDGEGKLLRWFIAIALFCIVVERCSTASTSESSYWGDHLESYGPFVD